MGTLGFLYEKIGKEIYKITKKMTILKDFMV